MQWILSIVSTFFLKVIALFSQNIQLAYYIYYYSEKFYEKFS